MNIEQRIEANRTKGIPTALIKNFTEFFKATDQLMNNGFYISRGHSTLEWKLLPSIFRQEWLSKINIVEIGVDYESILATEFEDKHSYYEDLGIEKSDKTSHLLAMQHYAVPTRLLDWTLNPQTALFFAMNWNENYEAGSLQSVIWFLNPLEYGKIFIGPAPGGVYVRQSNAKVYERSYLAFQKVKAINPGLTYPVFFKPHYLFPRIVAQESVFSIHGNDQKPFEEFQNCGKFLSCLVIDDKAKSLFYHLNNVLKLDYEKYFPDIQEFAEGLRRSYRK